MSFDINQFDDDTDFYEYEIEGEEEEEEIVKLKKDYDDCDIQTTRLRKMSFDFNQFDDDSFVDYEEEVEEKEEEKERQQSSDYDIDTTRLRKMSFDLNQFDDDDDEDIEIQNTLKRKILFDLNQFDDSSLDFEVDLEEEIDEEEEDYRRRQTVAEEIARIHKMNNIAGTWIEVGKYDKAIASLGKSLKTLQSCPSPFHSDVCSLDECIEHSIQHQQNYNLLEKLCVKKKASKNLHRTPIYVPENHIHEGNTVGSPLMFLILTFNLALAHHLKALKVLKKTKKRKNASFTRLINCTIRLYELLLNVGNNNNTSDVNTLKVDGNERFYKIVRNNLNRLKKKTNDIDTIDKKVVEDDTTSEKTEKMKLVLEKSAPSSLYEQHKELLRQRYSAVSLSSTSTSTKTTTTIEPSSSSSITSSLKNVKDEEKDDCFSLRLQNAIRTSSSFGHLQQRQNVSTAFAA